MTVPSLGAILAMKPAARALPAPGMFFATIVRLARDVAADVARQRAPVDVVAAAGRRADEQIDGLAGEGVGRGRGRRGEQEGGDQAGAEYC